MHVLDQNKQTWRFNYFANWQFGRSETIKNRERVIWTREWLRKREARGEFHQLVHELSYEDDEAFTNYFCMNQVQFHYLSTVSLPVLAPKQRIQKRKCILGRRCAENRWRWCYTNEFVENSPFCVASFWSWIKNSSLCRCRKSLRVARGMLHGTTFSATATQKIVVANCSG